MNYNREFITYGKHIDPAKFIKPHQGRCRWMNKPDGGLWASPVDSEWGWRDWCEAENFPCNTQVWTKFKFKESARIMEILDLGLLHHYIRKYPAKVDILGHVCFDWDSIIKDYDAVYLSDNGNRECHLPMIPGPDLNAWDCESVMVLNLDIIEITGRSKNKEG